MSNGSGVMAQKPLFHRRTDRWTDRQTAMMKTVYLHNSIGGSILTYSQYGKIVEKWPPGGQNFMRGVTFSRPLVQNLRLKFDPCQLWTLKNDPGVIFNVEKWPGESFLTLKNDPGSHFSTGSFLMLHRRKTNSLCVPSIINTSNFDLHIRHPKSDECQVPRDQEGCEWIGVQCALHHRK